MKVKELMQILEELMAEPCIKDYTEEMKNTLLFGDMESEVKGVVVVWKVTKNVIKKTIELGANTIIFHEDLWYEYRPYIVKGRYPFTIPANKEKIEMISKYKINLIRFHTRWDDAKDGNNDTLLKLLDLELEEKYPCMRIAKLKKPMKAKEFALYVKEKLKAPYVIFAGNENKEIKKVLIIAGAGAKHILFLDFALQKGCDAVVSGDSVADSWYFALENDLVVIDPGHQYLEQWGMKSLAEKLKERLDIPVYFLENERVVNIY